MASEPEVAGSDGAGRKRDHPEERDDNPGLSGSKRVKDDTSNFLPSSPPPSADSSAAAVSSSGLTLSSSWLLDKERSESMVPYLRLMGLSEMAIEAWTKAEKETDILHVLDINASGCRIMKRTRVQDTTERFTFGIEVVTESKVKGHKKKVLVTSEHGADLVIKSQLPLKNGAIASVTDRRQVLSGERDVMHQILSATNLNTKKEVEIHRFYKKTNPITEIEDDDDE